MPFDRKSGQRAFLLIPPPLSRDELMWAGQLFGFSCHGCALLCRVKYNDCFES